VLEDLRLGVEHKAWEDLSAVNRLVTRYRARIPRAEKGGLVEEESTQGQEEADVEGHLKRPYAEGFEPPEKEKRESEESEGPDVEGHLKRP
jgi:hypothetical protein